MDARPPSAVDASFDRCAEARRDVAARCGAARAAAQAHELAADRTRMLRRDLVAAEHHLGTAVAAADPSPRRAEKERAREAFVAARDAAISEAQRREATAAWAQALDRINRTSRLAARDVAKARAQATALERSIREAERAEQATRIQAEAAAAACLDARVRLADCEQAQPGGGAPAAGGGAPAAGGAEARGEPHGISNAPRAEPLVIESMVTGDRRALELAASAIAELGRLSPAGIRAQLQELVDAIESAAGEAGYLLFDESHPFWSHLSVSEAHDVTAALSRLGFRFEPAEGWHAGRVPTPGDLSMALGWAGLDARHVRGLPSADELRALPTSMGVDARAFLASGAPDLAMDQLVALLGPRAARLGPLWDAWGLVRPVLLGPRRALGSLPG